MDPREDRQIIDYRTMAAVPVSDNNEPLVDVRTYDPAIVAEYEKQDMLPYTGDTLYVRDAVAKKLAAANARLAEKGFGLRVVYGYRHPEVQERYFTLRQQLLRAEHPEMDDAALEELTHQFVAVPSVAGHPSGAAVDLTLVDSAGQPVSMGTGIADYADPELIQTFDARLPASEQENRMLLRTALMEEGFAPFNGEWWHFSYGDREWAAFYQKPSSLYGPVTFSAPK